MYKIGVIGDTESILGFKAVGFDIFPANTPKEAGETLDRLAKNNYGVVYIVEDLAEKILDVTDKYKDARLPAIIPVPGKSGSTGMGIANVKRSVERAVGADILFRNE